MNLRTAFAPRPVAPTLSRQLLGALRRSLVCCLLLAAPVVGFYSATDAIFGVGDMAMPPPAIGAAGEAPSAAGLLVEEHGCWTGAPPAEMVGVLPGHVVVSEPNEGARYAGERMVGLALDQIFGGADHGLTVHGFCR